MSQMSCPLHDLMWLTVWQGNEKAMTSRPAWLLCVAALAALAVASAAPQPEPRWFGWGARCRKPNERFSAELSAAAPQTVGRYEPRLRLLRWASRGA